MTKKTLLSIAMLSAVVAGSAPLTAQAANLTVVGIGGGGYCIQQTEQNCNQFGRGDLQKILKESGRPGSVCPDVTIPGNPGADGPGADTLLPPGTQPPSSGGAEDSDTTLSSAEQVVKLVNEERAKAGLGALTMQADITKAANVRAKEIRQQFSHTRPNGSSFSSALTEQGVSYRMSGENIAYGQATPEAVMEGWMNSSGHRANILNGSFQNIGVGLYEDEQGVKHWVQLFT